MMHRCAQSSYFNTALRIAVAPTSPQLPLCLDNEAETTQVVAGKPGYPGDPNECRDIGRISDVIMFFDVPQYRGFTRQQMV